MHVFNLNTKSAWYGLIFIQVWHSSGEVKHTHLLFLFNDEKPSLHGGKKKYEWSWKNHGSQQVLQDLCTGKTNCTKKSQWEKKPHQQSPLWNIKKEQKCSMKYIMKYNGKNMKNNHIFYNKRPLVLGVAWLVLKL